MASDLYKFDYDNALRKRRDSAPARAYLWCIELPDLATAPTDGSNSSSFKKAQDDQAAVLDGPIDMELLQTVVTSANTPFFSFDTDKVIDGSSFWYKVKNNDISNISLTFEEQQSGLVWQYLNNWRKLIINKNGRYNPPHYYKRDIKIHRLDTVKQVFQTFTYKNYFISEVAAIGNEYTSNSPLQYTATFTGDSLEEPVTIKGSELEKRLEKASEILGGIEIPYNQFEFGGVPAPAIANILKTVGAQAFR